MKKYLVNITRTVIYTASVNVYAKNEEATIVKVEKLAGADKLGSIPTIETKDCQVDFDPEWEQESDSTEVEEANVVEE